MEEKNKLSQEQDLMKTLEMLTQAYEEISIMRMQATKSSVLQNRDFLSGIGEIYYDVKTSYKNQIEKLLKQKHQGKKLTAQIPILTNGKSVCVLVCSNAKLYGDIIAKTFNLFIQNIINGDSDIVIVGKAGRQLFVQSGIKKTYTYFEIPDSQMGFEDLKPLINHLVAYEKITLFYGKLINVINQEATSASISGEEPFEKPKNEEAQQKSFLFEPTLEKILIFFQTQILTALFKQVVHEGELARNASRIKAMDLAHQEILKRLAQTDIIRKKISRIRSNNRQQETLSSMYLWQNIA